MTWNAERCLNLLQKFIYLSVFYVPTIDTTLLRTDRPSIITSKSHTIYWLISYENSQIFCNVCIWSSNVSMNNSKWILSESLFKRNFELNQGLYNVHLIQCSLFSSLNGKDFVFIVDLCSLQLYCPTGFNNFN